MKKSIFTISLMVIILTSYSQNVWQHVFWDNHASTFAVTEDNNFILSGYSSEPMIINREIFQTDPNGNIIWDTLSTLYPQGYAICIETTSDSGYIITDGESNLLSSDIVFQKFNKNNAIEWTSNITISRECSLNIGSLLITNNNNYISVGSLHSNQFTSLLLTKISETGDSLWTKTYFDQPDNVCQGLSIVNSHDNSGYMCLANYNSSSLILKINESGDTLWTKVIDSNYKPFSMINTNDNCLLINAYEDYDALVFIKIDESGNILWIKNYTTNSNYAFCHSISTTYDNGYITANRFSPSQYEEAGLWLMKLDENGDSVYSILPPADLTPYKIVQTSDSLFVLLAYDIIRMTHFIKTDSTGDIITGIQSHAIAESNKLICYPNPFVNQISFKTDNTEKYSGKLTVYNIIGEVVISRNGVFERFETINTTNLKKGVYLLELIIGNNKYTSVVEKQ